MPRVGLEGSGPGWDRVGAGSWCFIARPGQTTSDTQKKRNSPVVHADCRNDRPDQYTGTAVVRVKNTYLVRSLLLYLTRRQFFQDVCFEAFRLVLVAGCSSRRRGISVAWWVLPATNYMPRVSLEGGSCPDRIGSVWDEMVRLAWPGQTFQTHCFARLFVYIPGIYLYYVCLGSDFFFVCSLYFFSARLFVVLGAALVRCPALPLSCLVLLCCTRLHVTLRNPFERKKGGYYAGVTPAKSYPGNPPPVPLSPICNMNTQPSQLASWCRTACLF